MLLATRSLKDSETIHEYVMTHDAGFQDGVCSCVVVVKIGFSARPWPWPGSPELAVSPLRSLARGAHRRHVVDRSIDVVFFFIERGFYSRNNGSVTICP